MGWLDKLFDKKCCAFCGKQVNVFNSFKLTDGYICTQCNNGNGRYFGPPKGRSVEELRKHKQYREENRERVGQFVLSRKLTGDKDHLYIDDEHGWFCFAQLPPDVTRNPDLFRMEWVTGCEAKVYSSRTEQTYYDAESKKNRSYNPPRYAYEYSAKLLVELQGTTLVDHLTVHCGVCRSYDVPLHPEQYAHIINNAKRMRAALLPAQEGAERVAPRKCVLCPHCGATTLPDALGRCEYCMSALEV